MVDARETYRTIADGASASLTVRGSTFIGHVAPAASVAAAEAVVERVREAHDDAIHNVPAYRVRVGDATNDAAIGENDPSQRRLLREYASDNGEPSGSAGTPILNVLQGNGVKNVVCIITRYYGGTNLGIGGLARSYGSATKEALDTAGVVGKTTHRASNGDRQIR